MEKEIEEKDIIKYQLNNLLRADATRIIEDKKMSAKEKKKNMQFIEKMKNYIDNFEINLKLIEQAKIYNERMEDDLR